MREHYLGVGARTAVGRTPAVTGEMESSGDRVTRARLRADLTQLRSDQPDRDSASRGRAIETDRFPAASFVLTEPFRISTARRRAPGTLELHGRRAPFQFVVAGRVRSRREIELVGVGRVDFARG